VQSTRCSTRAASGEPHRDLDDDDPLIFLSGGKGFHVGIPTAFLDGPGHILMMFDSGLHPRNALALSVDEDLYVVDGERVWIPVETTMIGKSFLDGWSEGAAIYQRWKSAADFHVTPIEAAWAEYIPSLPETPASDVKPPAAAAIDKRFAADLDTLKAWQAAYLKQKFLEPLDSHRSPRATPARRTARARPRTGRPPARRRRSGTRCSRPTPRTRPRSTTAATSRCSTARATEAASYYDRARALDQDRARS
jgi:hypothetical protein